MTFRRSTERLERHFKQVLEELNIDLQVGELKNTPARMARSWLELTRSYVLQEPKVMTFKMENVQILGIHSLHYFSLCEHHGLPFEGEVCVMYVPNEKLIGLSKPARLVSYYSHFLMIQERFTHQVLEAIKKAADPVAIYVISRGRHLCSAMRGVESREHEYVVEDMWFNNVASKETWEQRLRNSEKLSHERVYTSY